MSTHVEKREQADWLPARIADIADPQPVNCM